MATYFIKDNGLIKVNETVKFPKDAPDWFKPPKDCGEYKAGSQGSKYFINTKTGLMYMYEVEL